MLSAALSTAHTLRSSITLSAELDNSISPERKREIEQQIGTFEGVEKVSMDKTKLNEGKQRYLDSRKGDKRFRLLENEQGMYEGDIFYFTCIGEEAELRPVYELLADDERYTCTLQQEIYRPEYWLEIMPKKATKAEAIQTLKKLWDCDRVVSFGDAVNDIPMFKQVPFSIAMGNAIDELKSIAYFVSKDIDDDGIEYACKYFGLV